MMVVFDILCLATTVVGVWCLMATPMVALILGLELMLWADDAMDAAHGDEDRD